MGVFVGVLMVAGVAAFLLYPYLSPALEPLHEPGGPSARIGLLEERKLALYGAIRDLGFDFRTDKVTEQDYPSEMESLKAEAVAVVSELESLRAQPPRGSDRLEEEIRAAREQAPAETGEALFCTQCGRRARDRRSRRQAAMNREGTDADTRGCGGPWTASRGLTSQSESSRPFWRIA